MCTSILNWCHVFCPFICLSIPGAACVAAAKPCKTLRRLCMIWGLCKFVSVCKMVRRTCFTCAAGDVCHCKLTTKAVNASSQEELENRLHALTETLIQKQAMIEALSTEKSSLGLQLERVEVTQLLTYWLNLPLLTLPESWFTVGRATNRQNILSRYSKHQIYSRLWRWRVSVETAIVCGSLNAFQFRQHAATVLLHRIR